MKTARRTFAAFLICVCSLSIAIAQQRDSPTAQSPVPIVTATASSERVRYASLGEVHQSRLQVFSPTGAQVYDSGLRLGNLIDWKLQNQQGQSLPDGSYLSLLTVTNFSGRLTQKYGSVVLEEGQVYLQQSSRAELSAAQSSAMDASKQADSFTPIDRIGAAGLNRAALTDTGTQSDGTTSSASTPVDTPPSAVSGTGTAGRIVKWADGAGTLMDANLFEAASGNIGLGTTDLTDVILAGNDKFKVVDGTMTFSFRDFASGQGYFAVGSSTNGVKGFVGHTNSTDGFTLGSFSNHKVTIRTNSLNRLTIDTAGNVGIGTTTPTARLMVTGGDVQIATVGKGLKFADGTLQTTAAVGTIKIIADGLATVSCPVGEGDAIATITLPANFEANNKDFRYQLTPIVPIADNWGDEPIAIFQEVQSNQFQVIWKHCFVGSEPSSMKFSWQVSAVPK